MGLINGQLYSAQPEFFTDAGKPAANLMLNRIILVTDVALGQLQISDGTNWVPVGNILGSFATGSLPSAATFPYRLAYDTTVGKVKVSDGASWVSIGSSESENSWELNGAYSGLTFPLLNIDSIFLAPYDITINSVWIYNGDAGSGGTTEYDLKVASPGGAFATILSTTGKITSAAAGTIWTDSGAVVGAQGGVTKPVISNASITAGQAVKFDLITSMTGSPTDARIRIYYTKV
jgi:hypothetical protein